MKRYNPLLCTLNAKRNDKMSTTILCYGTIAFCTVWLTLEFFTKLADSL